MGQIVDIPDGCGSSVLSSTLQVHVLVRGSVDLIAEIAKCEKKLGLAQLNLDKIQKLQRQIGYDTIVPKGVQEANYQKVNSFFFQSNFFLIVTRAKHTRQRLKP